MNFVRKLKLPFFHRKVRTLLIHNGGKSNRLGYGLFIRGTFKSKDGEVIRRIIVDLDNEAWRMIYCHELAHVLTLHKFDSDEYIYDFRKALRTEITAWRLAKSFCKKKYWNEKVAIECLLCYAEPFPKPFPSIVDTKKLKKIGIIPLNNDLRIPHFK